MRKNYNRCSVHLNVVLDCYKNVVSSFIIIDLKSQATGDMKDSNEQQKMSSAQNNNEGTVSYAPCSLLYENTLPRSHDGNVCNCYEIH